MDPLSVNLDGIPIEIKRLKIDLKHLILDKENPRIQNTTAWKIGSEV